MEIPVYVFTGFLESGKTRFMQETLEDARFNAGERTLIVQCEEGLEEFDPSAFAKPNVYIYNIETIQELTRENLEAARKKYRAVRVLVEYNGMWKLSDLYDAMPEGWVIYQQIMLADANTFLTYNTNLRALVVDKLTGCEMIAFNRAKRGEVDVMAYHKIVRGISRSADIAYEYTDGKVEYDDIEDPLPFDLDAPVVEIADQDYAIWYRDLSQEQKKYDGKTVRFVGRCAVNEKMPQDCIVVGRHVMTCCAEDIQFSGLVLQWKNDGSVQNRDWVRVTAKIALRYHKIYRGKGPVLTAISVEPAQEPEQEVATFY